MLNKIPKKYLMTTVLFRLASTHSVRDKADKGARDGRPPSRTVESLINLINHQLFFRRTVRCDSSPLFLALSRHAEKSAWNLRRTKTPRRGCSGPSALGDDTGAAPDPTYGHEEASPEKNKNQAQREMAQLAVVVFIALHYTRHWKCFCFLYFSAYTRLSTGTARTFLSSEPPNTWKMEGRRKRREKNKNFKRKQHRKIICATSRITAPCRSICWFWYFSSFGSSCLRRNRLLYDNFFRKLSVHSFVPSNAMLRLAGM